MYESKESYAKKSKRSITQKWIAIIATVLISCLVFAGCNNTATQDETTAPSTTDIQTEAIEQSSETDTKDALADESSAATETTSEADISDTEATTTTSEDTGEDTDASSEETSSFEETTEEVTENKDRYKNEISLHNRSVMLTANEFEGEFNSVEFKNHGLMLVDGATEGSFVSGEIDMGGSFTKMVASWNSSSAGGTVEVCVAVKLDDGSYTTWYSWGEWSAIRGVSGSKSTKDDYGKVNVDILTLNNECQGVIKYKITIKQTGDSSPILYNVTFACNKTESALSSPTLESIKLDVPYRKQQDVPEIGGSICSATSLSMVMLYHGEQIEGVEGIADVAWGVRDYGDEIFGNWAFNVAYAGELGYNAYVDFYDIDAIKYATSMGNPIVCSIKVTKGQLAASGFRSYSTNGHLICITGYEVRDGKGWLLVNDPAHPEVTALLESDFVNVYRGVSYIVQLRPEIGE